MRVKGATEDKQFYVTQKGDIHVSGPTMSLKRGPATVLPPFPFRKSTEPAPGRVGRLRCECGRGGRGGRPLPLPILLTPNWASPAGGDVLPAGERRVGREVF